MLVPPPEAEHRLGRKPMNMSRVVRAGVAPGVAAAVIFTVISALFFRFDGTLVIEGVALGIAAGVVSLVIATLVAANRRRTKPPAA
jgi:hypothetical protein